MGEQVGDGDRRSEQREKKQSVPGTASDCYMHPGQGHWNAIKTESLPEPPGDCRIFRKRQELRS